MADDLKRVGLIFDAKGAVDFKASLKSVNTALTDNRNQFKLTKSTWDENTKASEKLRATNEYLANQYEASARKVSVLKDEIEELENAEKRDEVAISKKKSALASTQAAMNHYKKGLDETSAKLKAGIADLEEYAKRLQETGDKAKKVGSTLTKGITAPIVATGTAATAAWVEIDEAYDSIAAGTGALGDNLLELQDVFDEVYGGMPVTAEEASTAVADLNTRFGFTGEALSKASEDFLKFSKVNKTDTATAIQLVSRAMGDASIPAEEYSGVLDALTAASQASGLSIDKLTENLTKYGAPMRALGYTTQESIAIFAQWEKAGVNTEIAFSGMKKAISNWSAEGKDARVEFKKTLEEIATCPDIASATTKAIETFGAKAGPDLADAIQAGRFSVEEMTKVVEQSGGALENTYNAMLSPSDKAKVAMNNLTLAGAALGDAIQETLAPVWEKLANVIESVTKWFRSLNDTTKTVIVVIGGIVAAIGPLLVIFGTLAGSVSKIILMYTNFKAATAGVAGSTSLLAKAMAALSPPIMAIIALVTAIVAALVQLWNTNEGFRNSVQSAIESISSVLTNIWETIIQPIFTRIQEIIMSVWENGLKPLWDKWVEFIGDITVQMAGLLERIMPVVDWFVETFGPMLVFVFDLVGSVFGDTVTTILQVAGALLSNIGDVVSNIIGVFSGIIDFISNVFTGNWQGAWDSIVSIFGNIFDGLINVAKVPINIIIGFINGMVGGVESGVNAVIRAMNSLSFDVPDWIPLIGGQHWGFDLGLVSFGRIPYLAKGGQLLSGMAMVAEAGPELLLQQGNRTTVAPLTNGGGATPVDIIDYDKMALAMVRAFKGMAVKIWDEKIGEIMDERIIKAVA